MKAIASFITIFLFCQVIFAQNKKDKPEKNLISTSTGFSFKNAENYFYNSKFDSCISFSNSAFQANPNNKEVRLTAQEWVIRSKIKLGDYEQENKLDSLIEVSKKSFKSIYALLLIDKSEILLQKGYSEDALEVVSEAENIISSTTKTSNQLSSSIYAQKSIVYWNLGNVETALEYSYKSLEINKNSTNPNQLVQAKILNNLGLILLTNQVEEAQNYFLKAKDIYESLKKQNSLEYANLLNNIAIVYKTQKKYFDALEIMNQVLAIRRNIYPENHPNIAFVYATRASMNFEAGTIGFAEIEIKKAITIYKTLYGQKHPEIASAYNMLGQIEIAKKKLNLGILYFQKAIIANSFNFIDSTKFTNPSISDVNQAELMAASLLLKAHAFENKFINKTLKLKDLKFSILNLQTADTLIWKLKTTRTNKNDKIRLSNWSSDIYESLIKHNLALAKFTKKTKYYQNKAFIYSERNKASVLAAAIAETQSKHFAGIPDSLINKEDKLKKEIAYCEKEIAQTLNQNELQKFRIHLFELNKSYRNLITNLETQYPKYFQLKYQRNDNFSSLNIIQTLKPFETLISYTIDEQNETFYSFVFTNKKMKVYAEPLSKDLDKSITGLRNGILYHSKSVFESSSSRLYEIMLKNKINKNTQNLYWIPDGRLGVIPIEVLITKKSKLLLPYKEQAFLVKKYNISHHYSASMLSNETKKNEYATEICLAAPVDFSSQKGSISASLPGTIEEVNEIANSFTSQNKKALSFTYSLASESLLKSGIFDNTRYIHLATHGWVDEKKPELSKIILPEKKNSLEDGVLYAGEIYNLKLNTELVTLSACQTGLGKITKGEGMIGMSRSLLYAGAKNVMVSLWSVSDESTFLLMKNFYSTLLKKNDSGFSSSLREAKLNLIQSNNYSDPYFWAAFTLLGK